MADKETFYKLLGVKKKASMAETKKAYSRLARRYHPDLNVGDRDLEEKYRAIALAYNVLSDAGKRKEYDKLGHRAYLSKVSLDTGAAGEGPTRGSAITGSSGSEGDILEQILEGEIEDKQIPERGEDLDQPLELTFWEAVKGGAKSVKIEYEINCPNCLENKNNIPLKEQCSQCGGRGCIKVTETVRVRVPPGAEQGKKIKVARKGLPGRHGGIRGDLFITPVAKKHKCFWRKGYNLYVELPVSYYEALFGTRVNIPTASGWVLLTIPPGVRSGQKLRLKSKGIKPGKGKARGDLYVVITIVVPEEVVPDEKALLEKLQRAHPHDPRESLDWELDRA